MPRTRTPRPSAAPRHPATAAPGAPILPTSVYRLPDLAALMGTTPRGIRRAVREERLRYSRRGNRFVFLGEWVLEWIRAGEVTRTA